MTLFEFHGKAEATIDLTCLPFSERRIQWISPSDYQATQAIATPLAALNLPAALRALDAALSARAATSAGDPTPES